MWSGSIKNIPSGWLLCDGTKGTPDVRDRFVLGTAKNSEIGDTGEHGKIKLEKSQLAPHSHTGNTDKVGDHTHMGTTNVDGDHTHTGMTDPSGIHSHQYVDRGDTTTNKPAGGNQAAANNTSGIYTTSPAGEHNHNFTTSEAGAHSHDFTTNSAGSGKSINIMNPYYKLAFIMKK
ncbi:hypothetical protein [Peribacillus simplex]|uniref:hypothetical protein n=1 Tax=Peribacillus simplex TaxID=1478 RepID=UPI003D2CFDBC